MVLRIPFCSAGPTHSVEGETAAREERARVVHTGWTADTVHLAAVLPDSDDEPLLEFGPESDERRTR